MCVQQPSFHPDMPLPQFTEKRKDKNPPATIRVKHIRRKER